MPNGMDGVGGLTQPQIKPGKTFVYESETFMYHPHADEVVQMAIGAQLPTRMHVPPGHFLDAAASISRETSPITPIVDPVLLFAARLHAEL